LPVWYKDEDVYVGPEAPRGEGWKQDSDTLDTWFSAGLWTFSTLGWPEKTEDLKTFHPTTVMETGYDIIFFWVARMILMTTYNLGEIPFKIVYLHGLVRDEKGRKMSKSLDNVMNPLDMIEKYGADATRLSLISGNTPGNDMKLSEEKVAGYRNFANKLWNISRFIQLSVGDDHLSNERVLSKERILSLADRWILERLSSVIFELTKNIENYNFSYAGELLRDFTWNELADWYLEIAKVEGQKNEILNYILNTVLKLWHPFMPFVTETIWNEFYGEENILMVEKWPEYIDSKTDGKEIEDNFDLIKKIITNIRSLRADYKIDPAKKIDIAISAGDLESLINHNGEIIKNLARVENLEIKRDLEKPAESVGFVVGGIIVYFKLSGSVDISKERERLGKEIQEIEKYANSLSKKLSNKEFTANAPVAVIEKEKEKMTDAIKKLEKLKKHLENLN